MSRRESEERRGGGYSNMKDLLAKEQVGAAASYLKLPKDVQLFKMKPGLMYIDIIPFIAGKGNPNADEGMRHWERTFWVHKGIGVDNEMFLCPSKTLGEKCPICEYRASLASKAARDEDTYDLVKTLEPKERQLFNVIDTKMPDKGIQVWDISKHLFGKDLLKEVRNADERDHWDEFYYLKQGWTLKLGVEERSYNGRSFPAVDTIHFREREKDYPEETAEDAPCLDDCLIAPEYEDLKKTFMQSGDPADKPRDRGGREERGGRDADRGGRSSHREEEPRSERRGRDREEEPARERNGDREERRSRREEEPPREERSERRGRRDEPDELPRRERSEREEAPPERDRSERGGRGAKEEKDDKGKEDPWANRSKRGKDKEPEPEREREPARERGSRRDEPESERPRVRSEEDVDSRRERGGDREERRGRDREEEPAHGRGERGAPEDFNDFDRRRR
jgi:hypothetical protein